MHRLRGRVRIGERWARTAVAMVVAIGWVVEGPRAASEFASDAELEDFLRRARVVDAAPIGSGITESLKLTLELEGRTGKAAFKTVDVFKPGPRRKAGFSTEPDFTDDYRYERAAYVIDRELGLGMVPVAVLRDWDGRHGAVIAWVSGAVDEHERRQRALEPPDPRDLERQRSMMRVFDALILNHDRNLSNQLITTGDWRLHLIDHSRAFRRSSQLPERFEAVPIMLPREMVDRLRALDEGRLGRQLAGVIGRSRLRALIKRRDRILEKIERDARSHGDALTFPFD